MYWTTNPLFQTPLFEVIMQRNSLPSATKFFLVNNNRNIPYCVSQKGIDCTKSDHYWMNFFRSFKWHNGIYMYTGTVCGRWWIGTSLERETNLQAVSATKTRSVWNQNAVLVQGFRLYVSLLCVYRQTRSCHYCWHYTASQCLAKWEDSCPFDRHKSDVSNRLTQNIKLTRATCASLGEGCTIWMDNWTGTLAAFVWLLTSPEKNDLQHHKAKPGTNWSQKCQAGDGEVSTFSSGDLLCLKFHNKKDVHMLTTQHDESMVPALKGRGL